MPDPKLRGKGPIADWYKGKSIFITGASGFMGKCLLEKLLYQCNGVKTIYILLRSKRGRTPEQRIEDMWKLPMFDRLRRLDPESIKKVIAVHGDLITDGLGLSFVDRRTLADNVNIIFHCAATLRLEAKLKDSIEMNTAGTQRVIELAKEVKNLMVFVHFSTTFCCADIEELDEKIYRTTDKPKEIIQAARWIREDALEKATPAILGPHPNTYTYTKRLAEILVADEYPNLPIVIARPAIVIPAGLEPLPGWVDSLNGPMGLVVGGGKGVIRSMHVTAGNRAQVVPVDIAISATLILAWKMGTATVRPAEIPVYNMTNDEVKRMTWGEVLSRGKAIGHKYPFEMQIWYPDGDMRSSKFVHRLYCIFLHWIPAYLIDFLLLIFMQKRFMVRLMTRIDFGLELLQFFTTREWIFKSKNFLALSNYLTPEEKLIYRIDFNAMEVEEYFTIALLGARQYLMKEDLSSIPRRRRAQAFLYVLDRAFVFGMYLLLIWMVYSCSDTVKGVFDCAESFLQNVPVIGWLIPTSTKL